MTGDLYDQLHMPEYTILSLVFLYVTDILLFNEYEIIWLDAIHSWQITSETRTIMALPSPGT